MILKEILSKLEFGSQFAIFKNDECIYDTSDICYRCKGKLEESKDKEILKIMLATIEELEIPIMIIDIV